ncbi:hypothetical protein N781_08690 [Pontibacillus halophilus JSM 076056 = DSM 19796]|uniref:TNase-like domain-containing protein n=1 Tax=Pontibacillus halophilus JSM 076056 = DSM 19796 TaxID=1385510 RepID=A0A0A5GDA5_9BACI|nr:thermonuclease family protein [Pontibacillus halophilus]KGX89979.1 hypothetical protein N781_08690 [Pontibacillus halophilus JSM 076056 = DSM 19796]
MKENANARHQRRSWSQFIAFLSLLAIILLVGCSNSSASEPEDAADEPTTETDTEEVAKQEKEELPTREEVDAENGDPDYDGLVERDLVDITEEVAISEIIDGDTAVVEGEKGKETVSLALIDAPELTLPDGSQDDNLGLKANDVLSNLNGSTVLIERTGATDDKGHELVHFWSRNNNYYYNFNKLMLKKGIARVNAPSPDVKYLDEFNEAESEAKAEEEDIWGIDGYVTEDGFEQ